MSYAAIRQALRNRLDSLTPAMPTIYEGEAYQPTDESPWQRAILLPGSSTNAGVGSAAPTYEAGVYQINIFYPTHQIAQQGQARADLMRDHFDRGTAGMTVDGVTVRINQRPSVSQILDDPDLGDGWRFIAVSVAYYAHVAA